MDLWEFKDRQTLQREAAAERLRRIADALEQHNGLTLEQAGKRVDVRVPDEVEFEFEVEVEEGGGSIEVELSW